LWPDFRVGDRHRRKPLQHKELGSGEKSGSMRLEKTLGKDFLRLLSMVP
jgi:hypothetical protein